MRLVASASKRIHTDMHACLCWTPACRRGLEQALRRMLAKAGYYKRDLLDPRSLCLLRPAQVCVWGGGRAWWTNMRTWWGVRGRNE